MLHDVCEDNLRMISSYLHARVSDLWPSFGQKELYSRKHCDSATGHSPDQIDRQPSIKSSPTILVFYTYKSINNPSFLAKLEQ